MATSTVVTKENLHEFEERLNRLVSRKAKASRVSTLCTYLGNLVFTLCFLVVTCAAMSLIMDENELAILDQIPVLMPLWKQFTGMLPADLPIVVQLLIGCVAATLAPVVVCLPISILLRLIPVNTKAAPEGTDLEKAKQMDDLAYKANYGVWYDDIVVKIVLGAIYGIAAIALPCYVTYKLAGEQWGAILKVEIIFACAILALILLALFALFSWLSIYPCRPLYLHRTDKPLRQALADYVKVCEKEEKEQKAREEAAEKQRQEEERIAREKERREQAAELYAKATAGEQVDEELLKQAADLGDPQASVIIGKRLMEDGRSDLYTDSERRDLMKQAAGYFENAAGPSGTAEGNFLWRYCRVAYENNTKAEWKELLKQIRLLKESGALPEECLELCDDAIRIVVSTINKMPDHNPTPPPASREPRLKRKYCRFCGNGSICTFYSTSSYISLCKYPNNPGDCAAALMEKGLAFEFE